MVLPERYSFELLEEKLICTKQRNAFKSSLKVQHSIKHVKKNDYMGVRVRAKSSACSTRLLAESESKRKRMTLRKLNSKSKASSIAISLSLVSPWRRRIASRLTELAERAASVALFSLANFKASSQHCNMSSLFSLLVTRSDQITPCYQPQKDAALPGVG
eukprot:182681-Pleurochrysis_carterae.AAC.1